MVESQMGTVGSRLAALDGYVRNHLTSELDRWLNAWKPTTTSSSTFSKKG